MKAFWWFDENAIAGMARPGFNCTRWFDFPFEQALLVGWLGQHSSGSVALVDFAEQVRAYGMKILKFYPLDSESAGQIFDRLNESSEIRSLFEGLSKGSHILESFEVSGDRICFEFNRTRLQWEIDSLVKAGIKKVISLTERHHDRATLEKHFETFHLSINDLDAPKLDQVEQLAGILRSSCVTGEKVAVHCLAGIGRTSTMLIAAHMLMGESLGNMKSHIARRNPAFVFTGKQAEFLHALSQKVEQYA